MKPFKKIIFVIVLLMLFMFVFLKSNPILAQNWARLAPYDILWSSFPPLLSPIGQITGIPNPFIIPDPFSQVVRSAQVLLPSGGGGTVAAPAIIITNWSGSWYSLLKSSIGPMTLTLNENLTTGVIDGTVWFILHKLVPVPTSVSGTYTGVGTSFILNGVYTDYQLALSGLFLVPVDYYITIEGEIIGGTLLNGSYAIESLQESDFGGFNLNII